MLKIPQLSTNSFWSKMYQPSTLSSINALLPQDNQLEKLTQSFHILKSLATQKDQSQEEYRKKIADFSDSAKGLNNSAKDLTSTSSFEKKAVSGSVDGAISGVAKSGATTNQYNVSVNKVATTQKNESTKLNSNAYGAVSSGIYTFSIQSGVSAAKNVSVNIQATDNNKQVLTKFAKAINSSGTGVTAEVKTKDNTQYLSVTSKDTGVANSFTMADVRGNGIAALQLQNVKEQASDAKYTVNGKDYQSASNKVSLDNGNVTLQLNKATTDTQKIAVGKDASSIVAAGKELVTNYNQLHDVLSDNANLTRRGTTMLTGLEAVANRVNRADFANIGITQNSDTGELKIDEKKLATAIEVNPDKVKRLFSGGAGLAKGMEILSADLSSNSVADYLKSPSSVGTSDYGSQFKNNNWMYQQNLVRQGLFFDITV